MVDRISDRANPRDTPPLMFAIGQPASEFSVGTARPTETTPPAAIERLPAGALSRDDYIDEKITQATTHVARILDAENLEFLREVLRGELYDAVGPFRIT